MMRNQQRFRLFSVRITFQTCLILLLVPIILVFLLEISVQGAEGPEQLKTLLEKGKKLMGDEDYEPAAEAYRKVLALEPENLTARDGLVEVYLQLGEFERALENAVWGICRASHGGSFFSRTGFPCSKKAFHNIMEHHFFGCLFRFLALRVPPLFQASADIHHGNHICVSGT